MRQSLYAIIGTRRGLQLLSQRALLAFGFLSALAQVILAIWPDLGIPSNGRWTLLSSLFCASLVYGFAAARPPERIRHAYGNPETVVTIIVGDLFAQDSHLVIGFTDTFDTDITNDHVIDRKSIQGQFQDRIYDNDIARLDADLSEALENTTIRHQATRSEKPVGKLSRYPIGTVAVLGDSRKRFFCIAYSVMKDDLVAQSNIDYIWESLSSTWRHVRLSGHRRIISIPLIGTESARVSELSRSGLLKLIALSFVSNSRKEEIAKELRIIIHPDDFHKIDMLEIEFFLRSL